jgi:hypothetical protein
MSKKSVIPHDEANEFLRPSQLDPSIRPKGAGILKGKFFLREDIDLTKPIWEQVFGKNASEENTAQKS